MKANEIDKMLEYCEFLLWLHVRMRDGQDFLVTGEIACLVVEQNEPDEILAKIQKSQHLYEYWRANHRRGY